MDDRELDALAEAVAAKVVKLLQLEQPATGWLCPEQAAKIASVSPKTVRAWIRSGKLKATRPGAGRYIRIRSSDLEAFLGANSQTSDVDIDSAVERLLLGVK